jgi:HTH-type transcriptional regulator/antitoxin HigA
MIRNEKQYHVACARIEELLAIVGNETPTDNKDFIELDLLSDLVADYEEAVYPVKEPQLPEVIKLRMYEMGINQTELSKLIEVSPSRVSEYLTGKSEPTLPVARNISKKLNISASVILGV